MAISIIQLGTPRVSKNRLRIGTVRRPPRGVPRGEFAKRNFYDVWLPLLSPSASLVAKALAAKGKPEWKKFVRAFEKEMAAPGPAHVLDLFAALSHRVDFEIGCYCKDQAFCHRSVLRKLLMARKAQVAD